MSESYKDIEADVRKFYQLESIFAASVSDCQKSVKNCARNGGGQKYLLYICIVEMKQITKIRKKH